MPRKHFNAAEKTSANQAMDDATASIVRAQARVNGITAPFQMSDDAVVDLVEAKSLIDAALADLGGRPCGGGKPC